MILFDCSWQLKLLQCTIKQGSETKKKSFSFCYSENKGTCMKPKDVVKERHLELGTLTLVSITATTVPIIKVEFGRSLLNRVSSCWNGRRWWRLHTHMKSLSYQNSQWSMWTRATCMNRDPPPGGIWPDLVLVWHVVRHLVRLHLPLHYPFDCGLTPSINNSIPCCS